jgi:hypothetical protein
MPMRIVIGGGGGASRRAQPGVHTPAAATMVTNARQQRRSVSTEMALRLSVEDGHGASAVLARLLRLADRRFVENPGTLRHRLDLAVRLLDNRDLHLVTPREIDKQD